MLGNTWPHFIKISTDIAEGALPYAKNSLTSQRPDIRLSLPLDLADGIRIVIRTSRRAKRLRLVSGINGFEAVVPPNYRSEDLESFVSSKRDWITRTSRHYERLRKRCGGVQSDTIYFLGDKYRFHIVKDRQQSVVVSKEMWVITFHMTDRRKYRHEMRNWYKEQTNKIIAERLPALAGTLKLKYNKVSIKSLRSRWGSCSRNGNLSFSLLLAAAPLQVIDYVIVHELLHLLELDHSPRFWQLVRQVDPECNAHKDWLSSYAPVVEIR
jgi:predicted metal-dependent hydrolase